MNTPPAAVAYFDTNGFLQLFALGAGHKVWRNRQTGPTTFTGFTETVPASTTFQASSAVSVTAAQDGRLELFARGMDNAIWHTSQTAPAGSFDPWTQLAPTISISAPAAVTRKDGRIDVYAVAGDGTLWHALQTAPNAPTYARTVVDSHTTPPGFGPVIVGGDPVARARDDGTVFVVMRWADHSCRSVVVSTSKGAIWTNLRGRIVGNPTASANGHMVYALGSGWELRKTRGDTPAWSSVGTPAQGVTFVTSPVMSPVNGGRSDEVFVVGSDRVTYTWYSNPNVSQWGNLGGAATAGVSAIRAPSGAMQVFTRGSNGSIWRNEGMVSTSQGQRSWSGYQGMAGVAILATQDPPDGGINVLTHKGNAERTGANLSETILNTFNVNFVQFGHLFDMAVDGQVYAQPLYVSNVNVSGVGVRNLVIVATTKNKVYAFDADKVGGPYWMKDFATYNPPEFPAPSPSPDFGNQLACVTNIRPWIGITSTPVIDRATNTAYVEAFSGVDATQTPPRAVLRDGIVAPERNCAPFQSHFDGCHIYRHRLHAIDITNGDEKFGGPATLSASVTATGQGSVGGTLTFAENNCPSTQGQYCARQQMQRPGLLLSHGVVYMAFGGFTDMQPFHGLILGRSATNLTSAGGTSPFVAARNDTGGGIWQAGSGLAGDANGFVYAMSGNGFTASGDWISPTRAGPYYAEAFLKMAPALGATPSASFQDQAPEVCGGHGTLSTLVCEDVVDNDLGSSGPMLVPGTNTLIGGGKEGYLYLFDTGNMSLIQKFSATYVPQNGTRACPSAIRPSHIHGSPVYWGGWIYVWGEEDYLKAFAIRPNGGVALGTNALAPTWCNSVPCGALASYSTEEAGCGMPGGMLAVSSYGNLAGTGIVWAYHHDANVETFSIDANKGGTLMAFDATDLHKTLWRSSADPSDPNNPVASHDPADPIFAVSKNAPVTVANGRVYVATAPTLFTPGRHRAPMDNGLVRVYGLKHDLR